MEIKQKLAHESNYKQANRNEYNIKYIVIHYTANDGDKAIDNCNYFANNKNLNSSAHYFVDENEIVQSVLQKDIAWHCGSKLYKHKYCRNSNSIGIEICSRKDKNNNYYFKNETIKNAIDLTRYLMQLYNISSDDVIRHYDVTGKVCPAPFIDLNIIEKPKIWIDFKNNLIKKEEIDNMENIEKRYNTLDEMPSWSKPTIQSLIDNNILIGNDKGLDLSLDMIRLLVIQDRINNK